MNDRQESKRRYPRCGRIIVDGRGQIVIRRRLFGLPASRLRILFDRQWRYGPQDHCWLDYRATRHTPGFMTLDYIRTSSGSSLATFQLALRCLDQVAQTLQAQAIFAHLCNPDISERAMRRWGWARLSESSPSPLWVKRFYEGYRQRAGTPGLLDSGITS